MESIFRLAMLVIGEVLDLLHQAESGVVTQEQAKLALEGFLSRIQSNDTAADAAIAAKFRKDTHNG